MGTHEDGIAKAQAFGEEYGIPWNRLRWVASAHLSRQMTADFGPDHGGDIGSSDVSIHLSSMAQHGDLDHADGIEALKLIGSVAKASNLTFEEAEDSLRRLLAPA